jgi:hypothetical protein
MKTTRLVLLSLITFASAALAVDPPPDEGSHNALATWSWRGTDDLNTARYLHTATLLQNGIVLVAGGYDGNNLASTSAELYDPASGTWTATGSLNTARGFIQRRCCQTGWSLLPADLIATFFCRALNCTTRCTGFGQPLAASKPATLITRRHC